MSKFPFPMPLGWFGLCFSHELAAGDLKKVRLAGRDLVVFRTESGEAKALDNYCTHLGAALHQGEVIGEAVRCPFHHWQWNGAGECIDIPYAKKIPPKARMGSVPVREVNGLVLGWHHPRGAEPHFDPQVIDAMNEGGAGWGEVHRLEFTLPTCIQEIAENDVDHAHFPYVHGSQAFYETESEFEGPLKKSVSQALPSLDQLKGDADPDAEYTMTRYSHGPGCVTVHCTNLQGAQPDLKGEFKLFHCATPVEDDVTLVRWSMAVTQNIESDDMGKTILAAMREGVKKDIPIWQEKVYQPNPTLCDGDGPIARNRKWFEQFYVS